MDVQLDVWITTRIVVVQKKIVSLLHIMQCILLKKKKRFDTIF